MRLRNAMTMLAESSFSIKEIATACGFSAANYFSKVFLAKLGISPLKYRRQASAQAEQPRTPSGNTIADGKASD